MVKRNSIIAVAGHKGAGKTTWVQAYLRDKKRVLVAEKDALDPDYETAKRFASMPDAWDYFLKEKPKRFSVGVAPGRSGLPGFLALAWSLKDVVVVIEECGRYFPGVYPDNRGADGKKRFCHPVPWELVELCERGRHRAASLVLVAQFPSKIPACAAGLADTLIAFRVGAEDERRYLRGFPGAGRELPDVVKELPDFSFVEVDQDGGTRHGRTNP